MCSSMSTRPMLKRFSCLRTTRKIASTTTSTSTTADAPNIITRSTTSTPSCLCQTQSRLLPLPPFQKPIRNHQQSAQKRYLHRRIARPPVPKPTPFIPDSQAFLTVIGRGLSQHASKIPNWEALFTLTSTELRDLGVEPARSRRYLLRWLERFRNGRFGVGGDCMDVNADGSAELRIVETPVAAVTAAMGSNGTDNYSALRRATATRSAGMRRVVVNLSGKAAGMDISGSDEKEAVEKEEKEKSQDPNDGDGEARKESPMKKSFGLQMHLQLPAEEAERRKVAFVSLKNSLIIKGPHVEPIKASEGGAIGVARILRKEGLWEDRRGHKVDGGERRKAQVRAKRYRAERKAAGVQK